MSSLVEGVWGASRGGAPRRVRSGSPGVGEKEVILQLAREWWEADRLRRRCNRTLEGFAII